MSFDDNIAVKAVGLGKRYSKIESDSQSTFYALKNLDLELKKGEVLGIIGQNGSGKSTLLKILSGITKPSEGYVDIFGSVASILDIGTGIHPDLTGRQNIYLRGQLLGMNSKEIDAIYDELLDFSGVRNFIDSPVKHYSSGMFLRLAFSIIVHLNYDILLLDEVLAVGDELFRRKCADKIQHIVSSGKTVILVSHDLKSVMDLCSVAALFKDGELVSMDVPMKVISDSYLSDITGFDQHELMDAIGHVPERGSDVDSGLQILSVKAVRSGNIGRSEQEFEREEDISIEVNYTTSRSDRHLGFLLKDFLSNRLIDDCPKNHSWDFATDFVGTFSANWTIKGGLLNPGRYSIDLHVIDDNDKGLQRFARAFEFRVLDFKELQEKNILYRSPISTGLGLKFKQLER